MDPNKLELQKTKKDIDRLIKNRGVLFDIMTDMIFLIREDHVIEYMNPSAVQVFGDQNGAKCYASLHKTNKPCQENCPVKFMVEGQLDKGLLEMKIGDIFVECSYVPFKGYRGTTW